MAWGDNISGYTEGGGAARGSTTRSTQIFIPELWSDEVIAAYKKNLVLANLVTRMSHVGKKGDYIHIPTPARLSASAKAENTVVSVQAYSVSNTGVNINKHYEYSTMIEDVLEVQALSQVRGFYTDGMSSVAH